MWLEIESALEFCEYGHGHLYFTEDDKCIDQLSYCGIIKMRLFYLNDTPLSGCVRRLHATGCTQYSWFNVHPSVGRRAALLLPVNIDTTLHAKPLLESKRGKWEIHYSHFQTKGINSTRHFSQLWRRTEVVHCTDWTFFIVLFSLGCVCLLEPSKFWCEDYRNGDRPQKTNEYICWLTGKGTWLCDRELCLRVEFRTTLICLK